jgi:NTE family protein
MSRIIIVLMQEGMSGGMMKKRQIRTFTWVQAALLVSLILFLSTFVKSADRTRKADSKPLKIGLALGGGGARGMAHIGVLMALEEEGIPIDMIAGTSAGSIMGGLFAAGYSGREMRDIMNTVNWKDVFREAPFPRALWVSQRYGLRKPLVKVHFGFWKVYLPRGLINGQHISEELFRLTSAANYAARSDFDNLVIPFRSVAVDIDTGKLYAIGKGSLAQAIRASTAIPGYYYPAIFEDRLMVDGGILDIIPIDVAKEMGADAVIAVKVNTKLSKGKEPHDMVGILENMLDIMISKLEAEQLPLAEVLIEPDLGTHSSYDYSGLDPLIEEGYKAAKQKISEIKKLVEGSAAKENHPGRRLDTKALERARVSKIRIIGHTLGPGKTNKTGYKEEPGGLKFASQKLILRYFPIAVGKEFDTEKALKGVEDLYATGLFQNVWLELENTGDGNVDVNIHCLEGSNRFFGLGGNFRNEEGLSGFVQVVPFNLFGLGDRIMPLFRYGRLKMTAGLEISIGRFLFSPFSLDTGLYYEKQSPYRYSRTGDNIGQLDIENALGKISLGYQPSKNLFFSLGFRGSRVRLGSDPLSGTNTGSFDYLTLFGRAVYDSKDDRYFPTKGLQIILDSETVISTSSQGEYFTKLSGSFGWTTSLLRKQTLTPFVKWGFSDNSLPLHEQFRLGGPMDMPGYHRQEVWGNNMIVLGLRHRLSLYKGFSLQTILSVAGVFDRMRNLDAEKFITGISAGLAFSSPVGPVFLQYGWNGTGRNQFYLSIGYDF